MAGLAERYTLPGVVLRIASAMAPLDAAFDRSFSLCRGSGGGEEIPLHLHVLHEGETEPAFPRWLEQRLSEMPPSPDLRWLPGPGGDMAAGATTDRGAAWCWLSAKNEEIRFFLFLKPDERAALAVQPLLVPVLREVFRARGGLLLHAAGVVCPGDVGALIVAGAGGGKTTTALSLVRRGARLLADDLVVVRKHGTAFEAAGIPERLNLTRETMRLLPELAHLGNGSALGPHRRKASVLPQEIYGPTCMVSSTAVQILLFVSVGSGRPSLRPMPAAEGVGHLIRAHTFVRGQPMTEESLARIAGLVSRSAAFALTTGPDPSALGACVFAHLETLAGIAT